MCHRWLDDAPTPELRADRIRRLARWMGMPSFQPQYDLGYVTLSEIDDLYGNPRPMREFTPEELELAVEEHRVVGATHLRNFDDATVKFSLIRPGDRLNDDLILVYSRPCRLTDRLVRWLDYNNFEQIYELREMFGFDP
jgi:hypothetical protein